jgi:hypothetical protein
MRSNTNDDYKNDRVPGEGKVVGGIYWTQISEDEKSMIESRGMKSSRGAQCLGIQRFGSNIYAKWTSPW